jgi:hypothetical protein
MRVWGLGKMVQGGDKDVGDASIAWEHLSLGMSFGGSGVSVFTFCYLGFSFQYLAR